jgi:hypothetical protein
MYSSVKTLQSPKGDVEVFIDFCPSWIFFYRKFQQIPRILLTKFDHFEVSWTGNNFEWKSIRDRSGLLNSRGSQMFSNFVGEWAKGTKDQAEMNQLVVSKFHSSWDQFGFPFVIATFHYIVIFEASFCLRLQNIFWTSIHSMPKGDFNGSNTIINLKQGLRLSWYDLICCP